MLSGRDVVSRADTNIPPDSLGLCAIFRKDNFKRAFTIIPGLFPRALPATVVEAGSGKLSPLPGVGAVARGIQSRDVLLIVLYLGDFPFSTQIDVVRNSCLVIGGAMEEGGCVGRREAFFDAVMASPRTRPAWICARVPISEPKPTWTSPDIIAGMTPAVPL